MTNADRIAEIRIARLLNLDQALELDRQLLGESTGSGSKPERKEDVLAKLGLLP